MLPQTSFSLPLQFLGGHRKRDVGLPRDADDGGGGRNLEEQGGYHVLSFSPTTDLWGLSPSLNICLSPCTVGD